jgi:hypothetical protein
MPFAGTFGEQLHEKRRQNQAPSLRFRRHRLEVILRFPWVVAQNDPCISL